MSWLGDVLGAGKQAVGGLAGLFTGESSGNSIGHGPGGGYTSGFTGAVDGANQSSGSNLLGGATDLFGKAGNFIDQNQGLIDTGLAATGMYLGYDQAQAQQANADKLLNARLDQISQQEAERQRQIKKEEDQQNSMWTGFKSAGL